MAEKTSALEAEAFKTKRMQEETAILKRKVSFCMFLGKLLLPSRMSGTSTSLGGGGGNVGIDH